MDNDITTIEEKQPPVALVPKGTVTPLLGTVQVGDETLKGLGNNTRWVFDLDVVSGKDVTVQCIDYFGGREIDPDVMDFSIAPLSHSAWDARPVGIQEGAALTIKSQRTAADGGRYRCRVTINIVHRPK